MGRVRTNAAINVFRIHLGRIVDILNEDSIRRGILLRLSGVIRSPAHFSDVWIGAEEILVRKTVSRQASLREGTALHSLLGTDTLSASSMVEVSARIAIVSASQWNCAPFAPPQKKCYVQKLSAGSSRGIKRR